MLRISLDNDIANKNDDWLAFWDGESHVFSVDTIKQLLKDNPDEKEITIDIHCRGGQVAEGLAIYDILRNSGLIIHTNIEGDCHSMATVILLAAPKENRTANANCSAIIHEVRGGLWESYATASEYEALAESIRADQNKILRIYADRSDKSLEELEAIMKEEKSRTAEELLSYGFISKINIPNTNKISNKNQTSMSKKLEELKKNTNAYLAKMKQLLAPAVNFAFLDADGAVQFSTEKADDDDTLAVGDVASPDGTFTLASATSEYPEGTVVVITGGVIESITEPDSSQNSEDLAAENASLKEENENLKESLRESVDIINSLKGEIESDFTPPSRNKTVNAPKIVNSKPVVKSKEENKAEILAKRNQFRGITNKGE